MHERTVLGVAAIGVNRAPQNQCAIVERLVVKGDDVYTRMMLAEEAFRYCSAQRLTNFIVLISPSQK